MDAPNTRKKQSHQLKEQALGLLYRKTLYVEPHPNAYQIGKELDYLTGRDHPVDVFLETAREKGWVDHHPDRTYQITKGGCFEFWNSLVRSGRIDQLQHLRLSNTRFMNTNYDRPRAEKLFAQWLDEWTKSRTLIMRSIAVEATNRLVGSVA